VKKVLVSLPIGTFRLIRSLRGEIGESDSEVIRTIVIAYLSEQGYFNKMGPIRGVPSSKRKAIFGERENGKDTDR
jgi:hypothetical protein